MTAVKILILYLATHTCIMHAVQCPQNMKKKNNKKKINVTTVGKYPVRVHVRKLHVTIGPVPTWTESPLRKLQGAHNTGFC